MSDFEFLKAFFMFGLGLEAEFPHLPHSFFDGNVDLLTDNCGFVFACQSSAAATSALKLVLNILGKGGLLGGT